MQKEPFYADNFNSQEILDIVLKDALQIGLISWYL